MLKGVEIMLKKTVLFWIILVVGSVLMACSTESPVEEESGSEDNDGELTIGFSISTLNNPFFVTLQEGAEAKAEEIGAELITVDSQDDVAKQINDVEDLIEREVDVIMINPTDSASVVAAVESANSAGIPVVTLDRAADSGDVAVHVASDNIAGGELAGELMVELVGEDAQVAELEGISGSSAARERGQGFHNIAEDSLDIVTSQTANFNRAEALSVMENILQSNSEITGVFAHNDEMALGALEAIEAAGRDDIHIIGFDATDDAVAAVEEGRMAGTVAQQPTIIGETAIVEAEKIFKGEEVEEFVPVELELIQE